MVGISIFTVVTITLLIGAWAGHVAWKNDEIELLQQQVKDLTTAIGVSDKRIKALMSERVPLRDKCWCKHDAVAHDDNGCRVEYPFRWACACQISRDEVYYTPEPMKKMLSL